MSLDAETACARMGVSRETADALKGYVDLLKRWQGRVNLISSGSLPDVWERHVLDSAQLLPLLPAGTRTLLDVGSGSGFPGLVLAVLGVPDVHLVESARRKVTFLREAARHTGAPVQVHGCRVESLALPSADVVTARACAPLDRLLTLLEPILAQGSVGLFPKGARWQEELEAAQRHWHFTWTATPSETASEARILTIREVRRDHGTGNRTSDHHAA